MVVADADAARDPGYAAIPPGSEGAARGGLAWSNAHEDFPNNPAADKAMDLHNNQVGMDYAALTPSCFEDVSLGQSNLVWIHE
jgi:hypothetical protein